MTEVVTELTDIAARIEGINVFQPVDSLSLELTLIAQWLRQLSDELAKLTQGGRDGEEQDAVSTN